MPWAPFEGSDDLNSLGGIYVFPDIDGTRTAARLRVLFNTALQSM
jgi:hypothetical protein